MMLLLKRSLSTSGVRLSLPSVNSKTTQARRRRMGRHQTNHRGKHMRDEGRDREPIQVETGDIEELMKNSRREFKPESALLRLLLRS